MTETTKQKITETAYGLSDFVLEIYRMLSYILMTIVLLGLMFGGNTAGIILVVPLTIAFTIKIVRRRKVGAEEIYLTEPLKQQIKQQR